MSRFSTFSFARLIGPRKNRPTEQDTTYCDEGCHFHSAHHPGTAMIFLNFIPSFTSYKQELGIISHLFGLFFLSL